MPVTVESKCRFVCDFCNETMMTGGNKPDGWYRWLFVAKDYYTDTEYRPDITACSPMHAQMAIDSMWDRMRAFVLRHDTDEQG